MKTFFVKIEGQASTTLAIVRVKANSMAEAREKALKAWTIDLDFYEVDKEDAVEDLLSGEINHVLDEDGTEAFNLDDIYEAGNTYFDDEEEF